MPFKFPSINESLYGIISMSLSACKCDSYSISYHSAMSHVTGTYIFDR